MKLAPLAFVSLAMAACPRAPVGAPPNVQPSPNEHASDGGAPPSATRGTAPSVLDTAPTQPPPAPAPTTDTQAAGNAINAFGADLYRSMRTQPGNLIFSPASITLAFGMTEAGAHGDTANELRTAFHFTLPEQRMHAALGTLSRTWNHPARSGFELATANRLFGQQGYPFVPAFLDLTSREYEAPLEAVDFRANADAQRVHINSWVSDRTHARIQDLLPPRSLDEMTRLVLVNAVYLHARWAMPFEHNATYEEPFHAGGATATIRVPTMHGTHGFAGAQRAGYQVLEMPYTERGYVFDIVMPDAIDGLPALEAQWQSSAPDAFFTGLTYEQRALSLPKFRIAPEAIRLAGSLRGLGVHLAFDRTAADLTGIAPFSRPEDRLYVSEAFHKAFVAVDEDGTEAAAATAVVVAVAGAAAPTAPPRPFVVDRPFLFFLRDSTSGAILFAGRVVDPR